MVRSGGESTGPVSKGWAENFSTTVNSFFWCVDPLPHFTRAFLNSDLCTAAIKRAPRVVSKKPPKVRAKGTVLPSPAILILDTEESSVKRSRSNEGEGGASKGGRASAKERLELLERSSWNKEEDEFVSTVKGVGCEWS